jgi:hypothetical protein
MFKLILFCVVALSSFSLFNQNGPSHVVYFDVDSYSISVDEQKRFASFSEMVDWEKSERCSPFSETKKLRKNEMIDVFGFSEGDLDFGSQLEYLEKITELSNRKTYVLSLLRKPLNEIIKNVDSGNYSRRGFYADLYSLIPFLDPKKTYIMV